MVFFSGFCFNNEQILFEKYIEDKEYNVSGFSYGAIKAFEYCLNSELRINKLQLFSPAFFNDKDNKFVRLQLLNYKVDTNKYISNFIFNVGCNKYNIKKFITTGTFAELEELLTYRWDKEKIKKLLKKGIILEIFLGQDDKIINIEKTKDFFEEYASVYMIKNANHILI